MHLYHLRLDKYVYSKYSVLAIFRPRESDNQIVALKMYSTEIAVRVCITNIEFIFFFARVMSI